MTTRDLCFTPATELQRLYRRGQASPLEVMEAVLARVDAVNPKLNAIVTLTRESALREAMTDARLHGVTGKEITPFLLERLRHATGGHSLHANRTLIVANAALAAAVTLKLSER